MSGDQFSQEFQLLYQTDPVIGVVGLYYFEQSSDDIATIYLNPPPPGVQRDSDNNKVDNTSWAAFTQWTFKFGDKFSLRVGAGRQGLVSGSVRLLEPSRQRLPVQWYRDTFTSFILRRRLPSSGPTTRYVSQLFEGFRAAAGTATSIPC